MRSPSRRSRPQPRTQSQIRTRTRRGFTLLEVLGAVAVLGLWYVVLAGIAMQGLRSEGESERRQHASLIADEILADLETQVAAGTIPPLASDETEREEFTVRLEVANLELPITPGDPEDEGRRRSPGDPEAAQSILTSVGPDGGGLLRTLHVEVAWIEGASERSVSRTTYAFDITSARPLLEGIAPEDPEDDPEIDEERDTDDFDDDDIDEGDEE